MARTHTGTIMEQRAKMRQRQRDRLDWYTGLAFHALISRSPDPSPAVLQQIAEHAAGYGQRMMQLVDSTAKQDSEPTNDDQL